MRISVIIPIFNRALLINRAIDSVLAQELPSGSSATIIVVDDGSTDNLATVLSCYGNRITYIRHDCNYGAAAARNTGVVASSCDYVAFLDSDDIWLPGKLVQQIAAMRENRWVASCTAYCLARLGWPEIVSPRYRTGQIGLDEFAWGCFVSPGTTMIFERAVFDEIGPIDTALRRLEDWDWLLRYARKYPLGFLAQPLARIEVLPYQDAKTVIAALDVIYSHHFNSFSGRQRNYFAAGLELERAAANYRQKNYLKAAIALVKTFCHAPVRNDALAAILHNRFAQD